MKKEILVYCEQRDGELQKVSLELLGAASKLAKASDEVVAALLLGSDVEGLSKTLISHGADKVYLVDNKNLKHYLTEQYAQAASYVIKEHTPNVVLFPATSIGRDIAPRLSARLHTGLTADCTKLEMDEDGNLFSTRPALGGNLFATIVCPDHRPQMSTVRPGVMEINEVDESRSGEVIKIDVPFEESRFKVKLVEEKVEAKAGVAIGDAKKLISVGRGAKAELEKAKELASLIGAEVSCSRTVVDDGLLPQAKQVGQTGTTVKPLLYLAVGISGAVQHLAGMSGSEFIVAINKDKNANIFNVAHLAVVGDASKVIPALIEEVKKAQ